ncbi:MAG: acyl carrier protein [Azoarcus sp.]|nr:acyl carrier protein [Azoarcus sp.]
MGLDLVELALSAEETFGIEINDDDAAQIQTPGDLADYVAARIPLTKGVSLPCLSQMRFYHLRSALIKTLGVPRGKIRPMTPLAELIQQDRYLPERWKQLNTALAVSQSAGLPRLELPPPLRAWVMAIKACVPIIFLLYAMLALWPFPRILAALFVLCLATLFLTDSLTRQKRTRIPQEFGTVAALLPRIEISRPPALAWTRATILEEVIRITSVQSGVPEKEIGEHSRFVQDLGME